MKAWPTPGLFQLLAHQGGWDEILMVLGPLLVVGGALWVANRRVASQLDAEGLNGEAINSEGLDPEADPAAEATAPTDR